MNTKPHMAFFATVRSEIEGKPIARAMGLITRFFSTSLGIRESARRLSICGLGFGCSVRGISGAVHDLVPNGSQTTRPEIPPTLETPLPPDEIRRHLTENEAQRKEVTGYINQLSIQLHRWQLRLQKLDERHKELEKGLVPGT